MGLIAPVQKDDELLVDVVAADPADEFALWWLGQAGFLLKHRHRYLLFDPYLSDSLSRKYAHTEAAELPHLIGARLAIVCHYEMFRFNTASPATFAEACNRLDQPFRVLRCGERFTGPAQNQQGEAR